MKIKYPSTQVHHYHHICYKKNPMRWIILGIVILSPIYALLESINKTSHGIFLKWTNSLFSSYWGFLSKIVTFAGWKRGFGFFWYEHSWLGIMLFLGVPIIGIIALVLLLKRDPLMRQLIIILYLWHYGVSAFIHTHTPWMIMLTTVGSIFSLIWVNQLIGIIYKKFIDWRDNHTTFLRSDWFSNKKLVLKKN